MNLSVSCLKSVPFGKYCLTSLFVFSIAPFCHDARVEYRSSWTDGSEEQSEDGVETYEYVMLGVIYDYDGRPVTYEFFYE